MWWNKKDYGCGNLESPLAHSKTRGVTQHQGLPQACKELDVSVHQGADTLLCFLQLNWNKSCSKHIFFLFSFHSKAKLTLNDSHSDHSTGLSSPSRQRFGAFEVISYFFNWILHVMPQFLIQILLFFPHTACDQVGIFPYPCLYH